MNRYLRILRITTLTLVVSLLLVGYAAAQTSSNVTGIIYDADGAVVIGAVVVVKDSDPIRGTATDLKGEFAIDATSDDILEISSLGYKSVAVKLNSRNYIEVRLEEEVSEMDEVVVVGYGEQKKSNLAGAVVSVGGEVVDGITTPDILNSMSGVTPGVGIYQYSSEPGTYDTDIDVRGMGTPLIIIDGAERSQEEFSRLSNSEIESISVLKDASAAIYGVKASNGVVLVTTKQGLKQRPTVSYSGRFGVQMVTDYVEQVTALQYGEMYNESQINTYIRQRSYFQKEDEIWQKLKFDAEYFEDCLSGEQQTYSYMDLLLNETAKQHQHSASVRGGNESTTYYANLSYFFEDGLYRSGSLFSDKINVRLNVTTKLTESLKLNINVSYINTTRSAPSQSLTNIFNSAIIYPVYEEPYANGNSDYLAASEFSILNPLATSDSDISGGADTDERYLQSNFELQFNPVAAKNLTLKARYSYDYNNRDIETFNKQYNLYEYMPNDDEYAAYTYNGPSNFSHEQRKIIRWTSQFSGDYKKTAGKHAFNAMLLFEAKSSDTYTAESYTELLIDEIPSLSAGLSSSDQVSSSSAVETTMSGVSRLNYTFDNKYIVEGIVRADGSSKFAKGNRWGVFYSALGAWRFSEEKFVKNRLKFLSNGKLRFSYGMMGDDGSAVSQYDTGYTYPSGDIDLGVNSSTVEGGYGFGDVWYSALGINDVANTDLTWYTSETINLGLDL